MQIETVPRNPWSILIGFAMCFKRGLVFARGHPSRASPNLTSSPQQRHDALGLWLRITLGSTTVSPDSADLVSSAKLLSPALCYHVCLNSWRETCCAVLVVVVMSHPQPPVITAPVFCGCSPGPTCVTGDQGSASSCVAWIVVGCNYLFQITNRPAQPRVTTHTHTHVSFSVGMELRVCLCACTVMR